jgi:hypothetical protein
MVMEGATINNELICMKEIWATTLRNNMQQKKSCIRRDERARRHHKAYICGDEGKKWSMSSDVESNSGWLW